jgi:hypothetical protein
MTSVHPQLRRHHRLQRSSLRTRLSGEQMDIDRRSLLIGSASTFPFLDSAKTYMRFAH